MKQAKQQSQDLRQTDDFLKAVSRPVGERSKSLDSNNGLHRQVNGRPKITRVDSLSRFSDPPAPPPQQPLPEKPDAVPRTGADAFSVLRRSETEKPRSPSNNNHISNSVSPPRETSQILSLVEALSSARREIDTQGARVKELERLLSEERSAREWAETRIKIAEGGSQHHDSTKINGFLSSDEDGKSSSSSVNGLSSAAEKARESPSSFFASPNHPADAAAVTEQVNGLSSTDPKTKSLESRLQILMQEMEEMRQQVVTFKQCAQREEAEKLETRKTLGEMIEALRRERAYNVAHGKTITSSHDLLASNSSNFGNKEASGGKWESEDGALQCLNPNVLPQSKEMAAALARSREGRYHHLLETSSPYASMLGVVLLGVGLMAYLNTWQKIEK